MSKLRFEWSSHARWPLSLSSSSSTPLYITVLDASFNPPHRAHIDLALLASPSTTILLLHSTKNADKVPSSSDPSQEQRLQMMLLTAKHLAKQGCNVAVARCFPPTFCEKSRLLQWELREKLKGLAQDPVPGFKLCFPQGWDTLIRFFNPKYYDDPQASFKAFFIEDGSTISCARRSDPPLAVHEESEFLSSDVVKPWVQEEDGFVRLFDLPENIRGISSTAVRQSVKEAAEGGGGGGWDKVKTMLIDEVADYIEKEGLYR